VKTILCLADRHGSILQARKWLKIFIYFRFEPTPCESNTSRRRKQRTADLSLFLVSLGGVRLSPLGTSPFVPAQDDR
jgi:hypothetical protein